MKGKKVLLVALISGLLLALTPVATTAEPTNEDDGPECNPRAVVLAEWMGVDCPVLMGRQAEGVGFGVIMKAYFLGDLFGLDWEDLVEKHMSADGLGWGQIMKAHFLADRMGVDAQDLLALRAEGLGWGEILKLYRETPGKPPWAGHGKPPWAGHGKPHRTDKGKPPWAGPHFLAE
jgi:hypothetical protein